MSKKYHKQTLEMFDLMDKGIDPEHAYSLVKPDKEVSEHGIHNLKKQYRKWSLSQPDMVEKAHKAVADTLDMKKVKGQIPSINNRLQAANMVFDRAEPKITRQENTTVNISYDPVDLAKYLTSLNNSDDNKLIED